MPSSSNPPAGDPFPSFASLPTQGGASRHAEFCPHAENAESAEFGGRARSPSGPSGGASRPGEPQPFRLDDFSVDSLPTQRPGAVSNAVGRIDQYDILRKLGGGGFGVVYLALDTVSGVEVALKTLHPLLKRNAEEMDLLRETFRLVCRLSHPNIASPLVLHPCRSVDVWSDEARRELKLSPGDNVMVMRYAPGVTLSRWRRQFPGGVVPLPLALEVARQVAAALDYAHSERIVHRDVKPGNIMVETLGGGEPQSPGAAARRDGSPHRVRVRILDFGLAAEIRSSMSRVSNEAGSTSGTRPYMAPEQWLGRKQDGRTDQYALACVVYEMVSGAPPLAGVFETGDPAIMRTAVERDAPEEIKDMPAPVNAALLRALAKNPNERFSSCVAFVDSLAHAGDESESQAESAEVVEFSEFGGTSRSAESQATEVREADVLRRKLMVSRALSAVTAEDRDDAELFRLLSEADTEFAVAEEALRFARFVAAAECLDRVEKSLDSLRRVKAERAEAEKRKLREAEERKLREAEERKLREAEERERQEREELERLEAEAINRSAGEVLTVEIDRVKFNLRWIPPSDEGLGFWMGETPVTQALWRSVMGMNPSRFLGDPRLPVESVSWNDCGAFLEKLNDALKDAESEICFRLPTAGEWEFACRAGAKGKYCRLADGTEIVRSSLGRVAWFDMNSERKTHLVGEKDPNAWGLRDMHGNVWEWTSTVVDEGQVIRGGSWYDSAMRCESSFRFFCIHPSGRSNDIGFRLCASDRAFDIRP